jgi:phospholipase A-2-activating protein
VFGNAGIIFIKFRELDNGDIVTACADGVARVWTRNKERICNDNTLKEYKDKIEKSNKSEKIDINSLPGPESLEFEGMKDNEMKLIQRNGNIL